MLLEIDDSKTVNDIEEHFQECFPFLKIELYRKHHRNQAGLPLTGNKYLKDIRKIHQPVLLEITSTDRIQDVVHLFKVTCGLEIRIFCQHLGQWLWVESEDKITIGKARDLAAFRPNKKNSISESISKSDPSPDIFD